MVKNRKKRRRAENAKKMQAPFVGKNIQPKKSDMS
jgi:hypothetical protein